MNVPQAGDSVLSVLPFLDTRSLGQVVGLNHAWNVLAKDDDYWKPRLLQKWPSANLLITMPGHSGKCYAFYLRRRCLDFYWGFGLEESAARIFRQPHIQTRRGTTRIETDTYRVLIELYRVEREVRIPVYHSLVALHIGEASPEQMPARLNLVGFHPQSQELQLEVNSLSLTAIIVRGDDDKMLKVCDRLPVDIDITDELDDEIWFEETIVHMIPACLQSLFRQYTDASPGISLRPMLVGVKRRANDESVLAGVAEFGFQIRIHLNNTRQMVPGGGGIPGGGLALLQFWENHCQWI